MRPAISYFGFVLGLDIISVTIKPDSKSNECVIVNHLIQDPTGVYSACRQAVADGGLQESSGYEARR